MSGTTRSSGTLGIRRKKALFRSWHRGMREVDLLLGTFADTQLDTLSSAELDQYEDLLEAPDSDLLKWLTGEAPVPVHHDTMVFRRIQAYRRVMPF